ncbi:MFS transporter [Paracoccus laeviglucosivorans]|uniref:Predicted arabinose efflux permease, MFS family n=1 Tax=Paracoccus laeviglucosivorans TaxID=1197861 RepID=A0A521DK50_9RHOB|nr:MFS transporter [Paracoccus laeviglucosivorans]SMO71988.1 Predicted arabinose efflux permease, MFS family [Paracoccus laeviglucosivorans]
MRLMLSGGIASLILAYMLSQFYRAFLAVLAPVLHQELGAGPDDLAISSGLWFMAFAAMQLPIGWALDRFGPRETVATLLALGGAGGAAVFALAQAPWHIHIAMALLGIGCAPVMIGSFFIFARILPPTMMSTAGGIVVGLGSLGNILGAAPLVWVVGQLGWRMTLTGLSLVTLGVALLLLALVKNPPAPEGNHPKASLRELWKVRELRLILPLLGVTYAGSACIRGLWAGPYLSQVFGASDQLIGLVTLGMGLAMVTANLFVGRIVRLFGSDKRTSIANNTLLCAVLATLWLAPGLSLGLSAVLLVMVCISDSSYSLMMSHGRAFLPPHLVGRGITLLNMTSIAGVGVMQFISRPVYLAASARHAPATAYGYIFLLFLIPVVIGLVLYLFSPEDRHARY